MPVLGGMLLGMLTYKPQLGLLVPIALIAAAQWRCIAAACATAVILALIATAVLGWPCGRPVARLAAALPGTFRPGGRQSPAETDGACGSAKPGRLAGRGRLAQGLAAVLAAWRCGSLPPCPRDLAIAVLPVCCCLATPHALIYDLPMLTGGVVLFVAHGCDPEPRSPPGASGIGLASWCFRR